MSFHTPLTVKELVDGIESRKYFLPSIQREFVWETERIEKLFDSLMRGFPIGLFVFREIPVEESTDFTFYEFIRNYHQRDQKHNSIANLKENVTPFQVILDGQQRMTLLYIGLKGSYAEKLKRYRIDNPKAYPVKKLYVNLLDKPNIEDNDELGLSYYFKFLTPDEAKKDRNEKIFWFEVGDILKSEFEDASGIFDYVIDNELNKSKLPSKILSRLQKQIRLEKLINYYLEKNSGDKQGELVA